VILVMVRDEDVLHRQGRDLFDLGGELRVVRLAQILRIGDDKPVFGDPDAGVAAIAHDQKQARLQRGNGQRPWPGRTFLAVLCLTRSAAWGLRHQQRDHGGG
jgi:hypothetical protein